MRRLLATFVRAAFAATWIAGAGCTDARKPAPGEVMLVVTTDMAVPADIDTLRVTVTLPGRANPAYSKVYPLTAGTFPATFAVWSGPETLGATPDAVGAPGVALISLDALSGGASGVIRVHREAWLTKVPAEGSKALAMPLDWLCLGANLAAPCASGTTCVAGACEPSLVDPSTLPDYVPLDGGPCFDTLGCFGTSIMTVPIEDPTLGCYVQLEKSAQLTGPQMLNVALDVRTSVTGSYGACFLHGPCRIPLEPNAPEGWRPLYVDGGLAGIGLPDAACRLGVAVEVDGMCPPKAPETPICTGPPTCAGSDVLCPSGWLAYSCAPGASAYDLNPALIGCVPARAPDPDGGSDIPGNLLCCFVAEPPPSDPLLIDDMSGAQGIKLAPPPGDRQGLWYVSTDDTSDVIAPPRAPLPFFYTALTPPIPLPDGGAIRNASCLSAPNGFTGSYLQMGFVFAFSEASSVPFDVSPYSGIRFWAWSKYTGQPVRLNFPDKDTSTELVGATCRSSDGGCGNDFGTNLTLTDTPAEYSVQWTDLSTQSYAGAYRAPSFDQTAVYDTDFFIFNAASPQLYPVPIDVCVAQIYFTR
jgi:hypothetical protein